MDYQTAKIPVGYDPRYGEVAEPGNAKDTPLNRLLNAIGNLEEATRLTYETTDRLCGSQPTQDKTSAEQPSPSGMFAAVNLSAVRVERMASVIAECMNRINRVAG